MPKSIYAISAILLCLMAFQLLSLDYQQVIFTTILMLGIIFKVREIYVLLKAYGHIFILFFGYVVYSYFTNSASAKITAHFGSIQLNPVVFILITFALLSIYTFLLYSRESDNYFQRTFTPHFIAKYINSNIVACYLAFFVLAFTVFQAFSVKYKQIETKTYLSTLQATLVIAKAHYKLPPEKYNALVKDILATDEELVSKLSNMPPDVDKLFNNVTERQVEIKKLISESEEGLRTEGAK